jgi:hypothetical protein
MEDSRVSGFAPQATASLARLDIDAGITESREHSLTSSGTF